MANVSNVIISDKRYFNRPIPSKDLLETIDVDERYAKYLRVLDTEENLSLVHYLTFEDNELLEDKDYFEKIKNVRGLVVDTNKKEVVCRSYPYTETLEFNSNDFENENTKKMMSLSSNENTYVACEGTILRVYWANDKWFVSTHRKIDSNKSFWSGSTFGSLFEELCSFEWDELNKNLCYVFLLSHESNRLIFEVERNQLMLVTIYDRENRKFLKFDSFKEKLPTGTILPEKYDKPFKEYNFDTFNSIGFLVIEDEENPTPVKYVDNKYNSFLEVRGNEPELRSRYIQLKNTPECYTLTNLYTEQKYQKVFIEVENEIKMLTLRLHKLYIDRYVHKNIVKLPKEEFVTLRRCHEWHCKDRKHNLVTFKKISEMLSETPYYYLLIMLNRQKMLL